VRIGRVLGVGLEPERVDAWAQDESVACLYFLARDDLGTASAAEEAGFRLMDVRVELARPAAGDKAKPLREARAEDEKALRRLARENHRITRFYADPHFPDERCDDFYETWIARSLEGWADVVLVAELEGRPAGYMTVHADPAAGRGSIGLISVAPDARGQGLGQALVRAAVARSRERGLGEVTVVTQGRNVPALRLFEGCGFRIRKVGLWFHKWYEP
jgi:dTDP-4-amino-4,6-dideoxy-D-galactose acyltransferase